MKRIILLAVAGALALAPLAPAAASGHGKTPHRIPSCLQNSECLVHETNGPQLYVATAGDSQAAGTPVIQRSSLGAALFLLFVQTGTYNGNPAGTFQFDNGNFLAANSACNGVTIKSSQSSSGTIWGVGAGNVMELDNRYCDQQLGFPPSRLLDGDGVTGDQWGLGSTSGYYNLTPQT